jgi:hypothetical protein
MTHTPEQQGAADFSITYCARPARSRAEDPPQPQ